MRIRMCLAALAVVTALGIVASSCSQPGDTTVPLQTSVTGTTAVTGYLVDPPPFYGMTSTGLYKLKPTLVEMNTGFPEHTGEIVVYERFIPDITDEYARGLAAKLGFTDEHPLKGGERVVYSYTKGDRTLEIESTGTLSLYSAQYIGDVPDLPSDETCIEIADAWLKDNGLYPEHVARLEVGYGGMSVTEANKETGEIGPTVYYSKSVKFITSYNGCECSSSVASILIGNGGEIIRVYVDLGRYEEYGLVRLITPQEAFEILEEFQSRLTPVREEVQRCFCIGSGSRITVDSITIEYWGTSRSGFLVPVYAFRGVTDSVMDDEFIGRVDAVRR